MARFLFVVNRVGALRATYTTTCLMAALRRLGAQVWVSGIAHLGWQSPRDCMARAVLLPDWAQQPFAVCRAIEEARHSADGGAAAWQPLAAGDIDAVWLRSNLLTTTVRGNPVLAWAQAFEAAGGFCFNATRGLWRLGDKSHLFDLPTELRPRSLLSNNRQDLLSCARFLGRTVVLKPAQGFGGEHVFIVERGKFDNINAILDILLSRGPVLLQEYLHAAGDGDRRVLLWQGRLLESHGRATIYRRMRPAGDLRNNLHVGGTRAGCRLNAKDETVIAGIGGYLRAQGIYLAGVDIVGGKVLEINATAPGGIHNMNELYGMTVDRHIAEYALERLAEHRPQIGAGALGAS